MTSLSSLVADWWMWMAGTAVQLCLLVPVAAIADRVLARWSWPGLRTALWCAVLLRLVWPPSISTSIPMPVVLSQSPVDAILLSAPPVGWATALFGVWLSGAMLCAAWATRRHRQLRGWCASDLDAPGAITARARGAADRLGLRRLPRVAISDRATRPAVVGVFSPVVVLPRDLADGVSETELDHVLLHELGHVKRRDPLSALICLVIQILYWFHPLVWLVRVRLATLREIACDADVVALASRDAYRQTLLRLARPLAAPATSSLGFFARPSELIARLTILERPIASRLSPWRRRCTTAIVFGAVFGGAVGLDSIATRRVAALNPVALELQGCLQLRYTVYAMLAEEARNQEQQR